MIIGPLVSLSNVSVSPAHDPGGAGVGWWFPRFKRTTASVRAVVAFDANTGAPCGAALCPFTARASTPSSDFQPVAGSFPGQTLSRATQCDPLPQWTISSL